MKIFISIIPIILLLSTCSPASPTATPTLTPTLSPTSTTAPTVTKMPTPQPSPTPKPKGIEIDYLVDVIDFQAISLTLIITNITPSEITLYRLASPELSALPEISQIAVTDSTERMLDYTLETWQGEADRHLQIIKIKTGNEKSAIISYTLDLSAQTYWQVTPSYVAIAENQLFFQPDPDTLDVLKLQFEFSIPDEWKVVTRLTSNKNNYSANIQDTFRVVTYNHNWQRFFLAAPLVLGKFEVIETQFDDIRVLGAYPIGDTQYAEDASFVDEIFAFQESILGSPSLGKGDYAILYVFGPRIPSNGGLIPAVASHGQFEIDHTMDNRHLAHEMFHVWQGGGNFYPEAFKFLGVPDWFVEGSNEFLGVEAHYTIGAFSLAMANQWHNGFYWEYMGIAGTTQDVPVSKCIGGLPAGSPSWYTCLYAKSHNVLFLLDKTLKKYTENEIGFTDVLRYLYNNYPPDWRGPYSEDEILEATSKISGYEFSPFFKSYITGNEILPLEIINGQLEVNWEKLPVLTQN